LLLFGGGALLWVIVYGIYIWQAIKHRFVELPLFGACADIGWEFSWGVLLRTNMGSLFQWGYRSWLLLDVFIFYAVLRYGRDDVETPAIRRHFVPIMLGTAIAWAALTWAMAASSLDTPTGANSAYLVNVSLSATYLLALFQRRGVVRGSFVAAWLKMLGTGVTSVFMLIYPPYGGNRFLQFLVVLTTLLDCGYLYALWKRHGAEGTARALSPAPA
jgi:hypothetical protein